MNKVFFKIFFIIGSLNCFSQFTKATLIEAMTASFEERICTYFSIKKENAHIGFSKYIKSISSGSINLETITTNEELELLDISKNKLNQYVWITYKEKREKSNQESIIVDYDNISKQTKEYFKRLETKNQQLCINYFDSFSDELMTKSNNKDLKELILTFRNVFENTPSLTASALQNISPEKFKNKYLKIFVAFELYYSTLNNLKYHE